MRICFTGRPGPTDELMIQQLAEAGFRLEVVAFPAPRDADTPPGVVWRPADLSIPGDWQSALEGCDLVVHRPDPDEPVVDAVDAADAMFQVVWGIEQADHPPALLLVLLPPGVDPSRAAALEDVVGRLARDGVRTLLRKPDGPAALGACVREAIRSLDDRPGTPHGAGPRPGSVLFPLDEFLLDGSGAPHPERLRLLKRLREAGLGVILSTSRPAHPATTLIGSSGSVDMVVAAEGSVLVDAARQEVLRTELIDPDHVLGIGLALRTADASIGIQVERGMHAFCSHPRTVSPALDWLFAGGTPCDVQQLLQRPATRMLLHGRPRRLRSAVDLVAGTPGMGGNVRLIDYAADCIGIVGPTADRSVGLQRAESILGVPRYSTLVCVGRGDEHLLERWARSCTWRGPAGPACPGTTEILPEDPSSDPVSFLLERLDPFRPPMPTE